MKDRLNRLSYSEVVSVHQKKPKPRFLWYLIIVKWLMIPTPYQVFRYEMPDLNLTIKELWHWCKE
ncbi:hypothetical protein C2L98_03865 [Enterococcus gallinarum]|nr:hypothetical protein C2L98_03865 [Enterococcus gallinarum]